MIQWLKELSHAFCHLAMMFMPFGLGDRLHDWNARWVWPKKHND